MHEKEIRQDRDSNLETEAPLANAVKINSSLNIYAQRDQEQIVYICTRPEGQRPVSHEAGKQPFVRVVFFYFQYWLNAVLHFISDYV